ncbi:hypothetical protein [Ferrimonas senticii]|uniref:hypothetical protein n=1 Tax=Ferrimonas senticii TaxID=394566 RepID=UPI000401D95F|nr:hypothetical protein [Ferrimonas senticii]
MTTFINYLRDSKQEKFLFLTFVIAVFCSTGIAADWLLQPGEGNGQIGVWLRYFDWQIFFFTVGFSTALAYTLYAIVRISQQFRHQALVANQLGYITRCIDKQLRQLLLTEAQLRQHGTEQPLTAALLQTMVGNIETMPYDGNRLLNHNNSADEHSLTLRLNLVQQYAMHVEIMTGLRGQVEQLKRLARDLQPQQRQQVNKLNQLLAAFNHDLLLNTAQEKYAKLFNAYLGLCQHLSRQD